jgi:hypothetical protein
MGALGYPASAAQGPWGRGSATSELDAGPAATDVATSAVEDAAAEHALVCELARPLGRFRLSVADGAGVHRIVGEPRLPVPEEVGGAGGRTVPTAPARDLDIGGVGASCGSVADCWAPRKPRQGEHSSTGR